ncbi:hypothetical protein D3C78_1885300 [compost metagenome]
MLAGVEQALGIVLFPLAFGDPAAGLGELPGGLLALAQQQALLLLQGVELLGGGVALLLGLLLAAVEDLQAQRFLLAVGEAGD